MTTLEWLVALCALLLFLIYLKTYGANALARMLQDMASDLKVMAVDQKVKWAAIEDKIDSIDCHLSSIEDEVSRIHHCVRHLKLSDADWEFHKQVEADRDLDRRRLKARRKKRGDD